MCRVVLQVQMKRRQALQPLSQVCLCTGSAVSLCARSSEAFVLAGPASRGRRASLRAQAAGRIDAHYFDSYGDFGIHRTMLEDKVKSAAISH